MNPSLAKHTKNYQTNTIRTQGYNKGLLRHIQSLSKEKNSNSIGRKIYLMQNIVGTTDRPQILHLWPGRNLDLS